MNATNSSADFARIILHLILTSQIILAGELYPYAIKDKYGIVDSNGKIRQSPNYDNVSPEQLNKWLLWNNLNDVLVVDGEHFEAVKFDLEELEPYEIFYTGYDMYCIKDLNRGALLINIKSGKKNGCLIFVVRMLAMEISLPKWTIPGALLTRV